LKNLYVLSLIVLCFLSCKKHVKKEKKPNNLYYDRGYEYLEKGIADSAFVSFIKAKDLFLQRRDSMRAGICLVNMGIISNDNGDYFGAQEIALHAISYFDQQNHKQFEYIRANYNNLGIASQKLKDYKNAVEFYQSAIKFTNDTLIKYIYLNNLASTYQDLQLYPAAINIYNRILKGVSNDKKAYARTLTNLTYAKSLQDANYPALPDYLKSLRIREAVKDLWGLNSSYLHLAEYYSSKAADSAFIYANKSYAVASKLNSADDQLLALKILVTASPEKETKKYFDLFKNLSDSIQLSRGAAKNQFALIRYQTEKHKADLLKSQAENAQKRNGILKRNIIVGTLIILLLVGYWWYRKRRKILQQEKEIEVKNTELKYVKTIHDKVANRVYHVMSEVENNPDMPRNVVVDKLEVLYNISRDISYEFKETGNGENYAEQLSEMLQSYSSATTEVLIVGNDMNLWVGIEDVAKSELYVVMQELMTNMKRHSGAKTVVIKILRSVHGLTVVYADDGVGITGVPTGKGLVNTETRIKSIHGTITFDTTSGKGLAIEIYLPFS
jgi:tetratricopeptide (TPR) repeat protein